MHVCMCVCMCVRACVCACVCVHVCVHVCVLSCSQVWCFENYFSMFRRIREELSLVAPLALRPLYQSTLENDLVLSNLLHPTTPYTNINASSH